MLQINLDSSLSDIRQHYANLLTSGANLLFLFIGLQSGSFGGWVVALSLVGLTSFLAWMGNFRRRRIITDTPTSRIVSAAQGYAEFSGAGQQHSGFQLMGRLSGLPCLWFRFRVERKDDGGKWEQVDQGCSSDTFLLNDGSGQCVIDPDDAEIITQHKRVWYENDYRNTEYLLLSNDKLYAIGEHATIGGANTDLDLKQDINELLAEWKQDKKQLLERFDLNRDGQIDLQEWELARLQAKREAEQQHRAIRLQDGVHMLRKPPDDRLFLISNLSPEKLMRKYVLWGWLHLFFLFAASAALAYIVAANAV